jgi:flagellar protein FliO/FliZ
MSGRIEGWGPKRAMWDIISWLAIVATVIGLGAVAIMFARGAFSGPSQGGFFRARAEPRIEVIEYANLEGRRKLALIRRDDVEHLIMIGGPVDVVIETGITAPAIATSAQTEPTIPADTGTVFSRAARSFGQFGHKVGAGAATQDDPFARTPPPLSARQPTITGESTAENLEGPGELRAERA